MMIKLMTTLEIHVKVNNMRWFKMMYKNKKIKVTMLKILERKTLTYSKNIKLK